MTILSPSGEYNFFLTNSDLVLEAFDRCGMRPTQITREHLISAYRSINLELAHLSNFVPNLWVIELAEDIPLLEGVSEYDIPIETMVMLDVYVRMEDAGIPNDIVLLPISRTDWAMTPTKTQPGKPTSFWFDRVQNPKVTLWPVPDQDNLYTLRYYRMRRIQDSNLKMGQTPEVTIRYLETLTAGVAARLAEKYMPVKHDVLFAKYKMRLAEAQTEDRERTAIYISPSFETYYNGF